MKLHELRAAEGSTKKTKRRGRGTASGQGKTGGRGMNGQNSRSGGGTRLGFEGGQMQLVRRIPKRGFNVPFKNYYQVVNVESLNRFKENSTIGPKELKAAGLIGSEIEQIKILGSGELKKVLTVKANKITGSAKKKFDSVGAKFEVLA